MPRGIYDRSKMKSKLKNKIAKTAAEVDQIVQGNQGHMQISTKQLRLAHNKKRLAVADREKEKDAELILMREYVSDSRRVSVDRINTIIALLNMLKAGL